MIEYLALAAQALEGLPRHTSHAGLFSFMMLAGFVALHAILPFVGGLFYAYQWRTLLKWVAALAAASFAANTGQELWANEEFSQNQDIFDILGLGLAIEVVPAFSAAIVGIIVRKLRDRLETERPASEVQL